MSGYKFRYASFREDASRRWYFDVVVDVKAIQSPGQGAVGIDLGQKDIGENKDCDKLKASRWYREANAQLGIAKCSHKKQRVKTQMGKLVIGADWSSLKPMLDYKGDHSDLAVKEVCVHFSTQICSCCGSISASSKKGRLGL
ncbi:hypothetical protein [Dechloromonas sp. ZS-1]|uniref:hypothetical protein n=1 Tax=Dechloromonas sp. ZS-1 TaxID=3138067 RepID=UPI0031FD7E51